MNHIEDGGPAFPWREEDGGGGKDQHKGMTLRDYFAGQALAAIPERYYSHEPEALVAVSAYRLADAMIEARGMKL